MSVYDFREYVSRTLAIPIHDVKRLLVRAPYTYKRYEIPKKSGGVRSIAQPAKETKIIQRLLMEDVFLQLPVHNCAVAYKKGSSIKNNAQQHRRNQYLSKFDFINFFGSITGADVAAHLAHCLGNQLSEQSVFDIARISCIRNNVKNDLCLSIGAPSSPVLSNSILYEFDALVYDWCIHRGIVYTRYADDLSFSSNQKGLSIQIEPFLREILREISYPSIMLNDSKTIHVSKKNQRRITGLVIANNGVVSLGRERKRLISAMIHRCISGRLEESDLYVLQGLLGFAQDAEPIFVARMRVKYGSLVIKEILRKRVELPR